ncbi:MAG: SprT family zinc-dependent metalloprotease [Bacteroidota bacterium]
MKQILQYGSKKIEYRLGFAPRKSLKISVAPDLQVSVIAPHRAHRKKIEAILAKRAPWILKQQEYFLGFFPKQPPKKYVSGESHRYLGRLYRLKIHRGNRESVKLSGRFIHVECRKRTSVKSLLKVWYNDRASVRFGIYTEKWIAHFRKYGVEPKRIIFKEMSKRWGSCTAKGNIILNTELIKTPKGCIEYVIVHELCHLIHRNHSQKFVDLQTKVMPDWELWKMRLEKMMA